MYLIQAKNIQHMEISVYIMFMFKRKFHESCLVNVWSIIAVINWDLRKYDWKSSTFTELGILQ